MQPDIVEIVPLCQNLPSIHLPMSFRTSGICAPYNGTRCASVLGSSSVFLNLTRSNPFYEQELYAGELLDQMFSVDAPDMIHQRCDGHGQKLICNYMFPPCTHYLDPKPVPLCR